MLARQQPSKRTVYSYDKANFEEKKCNVSQPRLGNKLAELITQEAINKLESIHPAIHPSIHPSYFIDSVQSIEGAAVAAAVLHLGLCRIPPCDLVSPLAALATCSPPW